MKLSNGQNIDTYCKRQPSKPQHQEPVHPAAQGFAWQSMTANPLKLEESVEINLAISPIGKRGLASSFPTCLLESLSSNAEALDDLF